MDYLAFETRCAALAGVAECAVLAGVAECAARFMLLLLLPILL